MEKPVSPVQPQKESRSPGPGDSQGRPGKGAHRHTKPHGGKQNQQNQQNQQQHQLSSQGHHHHHHGSNDHM